MSAKFVPFVVLICLPGICVSREIPSSQSNVELCDDRLAKCFENFPDEPCKCQHVVADCLNHQTDQRFNLCNTVSRSIRSAKKRGGGTSRTRSRISSAVNRGRAAVSGVLNRRKPSSSSVSSSAAGKKKKKGFIRKYGKYAVAGLAAYGTYKVAKKMSKGLRKSYDDDECWEYNPFRDSYYCQCDDDCNNYIGGSNAIAPLTTLLLMAITTLRFLR